MSKQKLMTLLASVISCLCVSSLHAETYLTTHFKNRFYLGVTGGWGSTTWGQLVPKNESAAMSISTPTHVSESGLVWGVVGGYEFIPQFALEANYMRFPTAKLYFDSMSLFSFHYNGRTELNSHIEEASLMAKIMLLIPTTPIRVYSSFGPAAVHRYDAIKNIWHISPTFGAGFNCNFTEHWMGEIGTNYIAGYGKAELDPTTNYVPFLYSVFLRIAYRF